MDRPTRRRLYEPTNMMVDCLMGVKVRFNLSTADMIRVLALMVGTLDDDVRGAFQIALEDVSKDMVAENVFERAELSLAVKEAAAVERKS